MAGRDRALRRALGGRVAWSIGSRILVSSAAAALLCVSWDGIENRLGLLVHRHGVDIRHYAALSLVLLPVAFYCLAEGRKPPVAALRAAGAAIALASDCNPGSAPGASLLLAMSMGTRLFGLTAEEALLGVTRHAARALGLEAERGSLAPGKAADFVVWNVRSVEELSYWIGFNPRRTVVRAGEVMRWPNTTP